MEMKESQAECSHPVVVGSKDLLNGDMVVRCVECDLIISRVKADLMNEEGAEDDEKREVY